MYNIYYLMFALFTLTMLTFHVDASKVITKLKMGLLMRFTKAVQVFFTLVPRITLHPSLSVDYLLQNPKIC